MMTTTVMTTDPPNLPSNYSLSGGAASSVRKSSSRWRGARLRQPTVSPEGGPRPSTYLLYAILHDYYTARAECKSAGPLENHTYLDCWRRSTLKSWEQKTGLCENQSFSRMFQVI